MKAVKYSRFHWSWRESKAEPGISYVWCSAWRYTETGAKETLEARIYPRSEGHFKLCVFSDGDFQHKMTQKIEADTMEEARGVSDVILSIKELRSSDA